MKKVLFLIPTLGHGGAERVLTNLVNHMDRTRFSVTVQTLFDVGEYRNQLSPHVRYIPGSRWYYPGNSHIMKLFTPRRLFSHYVREHYDVIVSYLEGPTARIVSGCPDLDTKLICFIHVEQVTQERASASFRSFAEAKRCYMRFHRIACVADTVRLDFERLFALPAQVVHNSVETDKILSLKDEPLSGGIFDENKLNICSVGRLMHEKGFDRLAHVHRKLLDAGVDCCVHIIGDGALHGELTALVNQLKLQDYWKFHGFQKNPYKYVANADLFVCSSRREGFSTAVTEALVIGTPVVSTNCSGARELLGDNNEYGIVTENNEQALFDGIFAILTSKGVLEKYKQQARIRGQKFSLVETVRQAEEFLDGD